MNDNKPKISIISPVYNVEKYLERCLYSLLNQTLKEIEIILVDDGSTDKSLEICKYYANLDSRIKVLELAFKGVSVARNEGLKLATGEFIGFVDSDDYVDLDFFEKLYEAAVRNDADISYGGILRKYPKKNKFRLKIESEKITTEPLEKYVDSKAVDMPSIWNKIYRKTFFDRVGLNFEEGVYYEDKIFVAKSIYFANKIVAVPDTYYYYVVNPVSIVRRKQDEKLQADKLKSRIDTLNFVKEQKINLPDGFFTATTSEIKIGKLPIYSIKSSTKTDTHYLFGILPILKTSTMPINPIIMRLKGRMANQMFEWAFSRIFTQKTGQDIIFDDSEETFKMNCFNLSSKIKTVQKPLWMPLLKKIIFVRKLRNKLTKMTFDIPVFKEKEEFVYDEESFEIKPNTYLDGYFQSYRYFNEIREELLQDFKLNYKMNVANKRMLEKIKSTNSVSIHFRRGDYLKSRNQAVFGKCVEDYYHNAVEIIKDATGKEPVLFVFSDDLKWVRDNVIFKHKTYFVDINSDKNGWFDLELMKNCKHNIIANSSFSWWGAWLNENPDKLVIAPEYWMNDKKSTSDLIPETWSILENR